jgi:hypothetical protein
VPRQLRALSICVTSLPKVLIYSPGDFFRFHRDSKKGEDHLLTLCVDAGLADECEGGELLFGPNWDQDADDASAEPEKRRKRFPPLEGTAFGSRRCMWDSGGRAGAFACWFATQFHAVAPVREGRRVVVQYNVYLSQADRLTVPRLELRGLVQASPLLARLGKDITQLVCRQLPLQALSRLLQTCKAAQV